MRSFVAVDLPKEMKAKLAELSAKLPEERIKQVDAQNLHITLMFLDELDEKKAWKVGKCLERISFPKFSITLKGIGAFPNERYPKIVWAGCESAELNELAKKVREALAEFEFEDERFSPHVSIARVKGDVELADFFEANKNFEGGTVVVRDFSLKKSILKPNGPAYGNIQKFELK